MCAGGDSSQDEAEDEAKAITVRSFGLTHSHTRKHTIQWFDVPHINLSCLNISCTTSTPGEICSSRVRAGPTEEDPVVRVPPEEAGRGALGSPTLPWC